jgi:hypothetical protein
MLQSAYHGIPLRELVGLNSFKTLIAARPRAAAAGSGRPPPLPKNMRGRKINLEAILTFVNELPPASLLRRAWWEHMWEVAKGLPAADCGQEAWAVLETLRNSRNLYAVTLQEIQDAMPVALFTYLQKMLALHEAGRQHQACRADRATHFAKDPLYAADRKTFMDLCGISELLEPQAAARLIKDCENLFSTYVGTLVFQFEVGADAKAAFNSYAESAHTEDSAEMRAAKALVSKVAGNRDLKQLVIARNHVLYTLAADAGNNGSGQ